jgi:hypothetical protein
MKNRALFGFSEQLHRGKIYSAHLIFVRASNFFPRPGTRRLPRPSQAAPRWFRDWPPAACPSAPD